MDEFSDPPKAEIKVFGIPGEIDNKGLTFDLSKGNKSPESTVVAFIPVVSHHEKVAGRDFYRAEVVPWAQFRRQDLGIGILDIRLV